MNLFFQTINQHVTDAFWRWIINRNHKWTMQATKQQVCKLLGYYENAAENEDTTQVTQTQNNKLNIMKQSTEHWKKENKTESNCT